MKPDGTPSKPSEHFKKKKLITIPGPDGTIRTASVEGICLLCEQHRETSRWTHVGQNSVRIYVDLCITCWKGIATADHTHSKRLTQLTLEKVVA